MEKGKSIRAVYTDNTVRVYQAYGKLIAEEVIRTGAFGEHFSFDRMTWIKPSFLWMMYRSDWATKVGQEYVFAIDIQRSAFDHLLANGVSTSYQGNESMSFEEWKKKLRESDILVQWDPERDIHGNALNYRSVQIGMRGEAIKKYAKEWIVNINDITEYVAFLKQEITKNVDCLDMLPNEKLYRSFFA